jgi:hypothetical protein
MSGLCRSCGDRNAGTEKNRQRKTSKKVVIPAKAGIHLDLILLIRKQNGFALSRE